jgi:hypothetical protein
MIFYIYLSIPTGSLGNELALKSSRYGLLFQKEHDVILSIAL